MVVQKTPLKEDELDRVFRALADRTRRDILRRTLVEGENVSDLAGHYDMSFAAVQKHVSVLETAGLVEKRPQGRQRIVHADAEQLARVRQALAQLEALWRHRIDALDALFESTRGPVPPTKE